MTNYAPLTGVTPYAMSKGGLLSMTRGPALEWGKHGIRVNGLAPGLILTDLTRKLWSDETMQPWAKTNTPLERLGEVEDLVGTAVFLASEASAFMTGKLSSSMAACLPVPTGPFPCSDRKDDWERQGASRRLKEL